MSRASDPRHTIARSGAISALGRRSSARGRRRGLLAMLGLDQRASAPGTLAALPRQPAAEILMLYEVRR